MIAGLLFGNVGLPYWLFVSLGMCTFLSELLLLLLNGKLWVS